MKRKAIIIYYILLLFSFTKECPGKNLDEVIFGEQHNDFNIDTTLSKESFGTLKINPIQIILSEIPVSFELFLDYKSSVQFQIGYIFPSGTKSGLSRLFEQNGTNGDASSKGLFSYRNSPFNNHGFSVKIEYRAFGRRLYYAPQLMYKYTFYKDAIFPVYGGGITLNQTESKFSNIFGIGFIMGVQSYKRDLVWDWYGGFGLRARSMSVKIIKIENPAYQKGTSYPNKTEDTFSFYPFINFGVRIGFEL